MMTLLKFVAVFLLLCALLGWMARFWRWRYSFLPGYNEVHFTATADGQRISLFRYVPDEPRHRIPVILCHGVAANRFTFDLGPEQSLARHLQGLGFDVWSLDLPGRGPNILAGKRGNPYRKPYFIDDYISRDGPGAIDYVRRRTGASHVHWVGHSMGGLILFGMLQGKAAPHIASGVAVGSPGSFDYLRKVPLRPPRWRLFRILPGVQCKFPAAAFAPLASRLPAILMSVCVNPRNVDRLVLRRALCHLVENFTRGEYLQFFESVYDGTFESADGAYSYQEGMSKIDRPLFLIGGSRDFLCVPRGVEATYEKVRSARKELCILGKANGEREDYGHGDYFVGKHAATEVFPRIAGWLEQNRCLLHRSWGAILMTPVGVAPENGFSLEALAPDEGGRPEEERSREDDGTKERHRHHGFFVPGILPDRGGTVDRGRIPCVPHRLVVGNGSLRRSHRPQQQVDRYQQIDVSQQRRRTAVQAVFLLSHHQQAVDGV